METDLIFTPPRRSLLKLLLLTPLALLYGCPGGVWTAIEAYVPVGIDACNSIMDLVAPGSALLLDPIMALIKAAFADLAAAVDAYRAAPASDKPTLLAKIKLLLGQIAGHFQDFLTQLGNQPGLGLITGLVKIIIDTLAGFGVQIGVPAAVPARIRARTVEITVQPVKRSRKDFEMAFNAALDQGGHPELHIPRK